MNQLDIFTSGAEHLAPAASTQHGANGHGAKPAGGAAKPRSGTSRCTSEGETPGKALAAPARGRGSRQTCTMTGSTAAGVEAV